MKSAADERERLIALLGALKDPGRAAGLSADDPLLVPVARYHRLTPLLSRACAETLPGPLAELCRRDRIVTTARNMLLGRVAEECIAALAADGVPTIVLKGLDYETRLYGVAGVRPTADVDLLVPNDQRRVAFATLDRLGFEPRAAAPGFDDADYHEVAWTRDGVEIDLHMALAPLVRCHIDYGTIWREAVPLRLGATDTRALALPHAAIFQALHMAIDHFAVPAIYLVDLTKILSDDTDLEHASELAAAWGCRRPLVTALALLAGFYPLAVVMSPRRLGAVIRRIVAAYGSTQPLPRIEQLFRKFAHFDQARDAFRYFGVQSRRNLREGIERRIRKRDPRSRLGMERPAR